MEVVCLILGPMLVSQPYLHPFWVLTFFHFYWKCFLLLLFVYLNGMNIFCRLKKYWCKLYTIWNHSIINALKFVHQWRLVACTYQLFMNWLSCSFTYRWYLFSISPTELSAVLQEVVSVIVSTIQYTNAYHSI